MLEEPSLSRLVRALLALGLAISLPFVAYFAETGAVTQTYQDALAAVVAFYFGASSSR
jgi:hypothetical protein